MFSKPLYSFLLLLLWVFILNIVTHDHTGYYDALRRRLFSHSLPYRPMPFCVSSYSNLCAIFVAITIVPRCSSILNYIPVSFDAMRSMCFLSNANSALFSVVHFIFFGHLFIPCWSLCRESRSLFAIFLSHTHVHRVIGDWRLTYTVRVLPFVLIVFAGHIRSKFNFVVYSFAWNSSTQRQRTHIAWSVRFFFRSLLLFGTLNFYISIICVPSVHSTLFFLCP